MNKLAILVLTLGLMASPVFADSALEMCTNEAKDAGIEDATEMQNYINDCVQQVNADAGQNAEGQASAEQGVAASE